MGRKIAMQDATGRRASKRSSLWRLAGFCACVTGVLAVAALNPASVGAHSGSSSSALQCAVANGSADTSVRKLKELLVSSHSSDSSFRAELGFSGVDSSAVVAVTDSLVCTRIMRVLDSVTGTGPSVTAGYFVVRAGPRYVAIPHLVVPRITNLWLLDTNFVFLGVTNY